MDAIKAVPNKRRHHIPRLYRIYAHLYVLSSLDSTEDTELSTDTIQLPLMFIHPANIRRLFELKVRNHVGYS